MGDREAGREQLKRQESFYLQLWDGKKTPNLFRGASYDLAGISAFLGEREEALNWLKEFEAYGWPNGFPYYIQYDHLFDPLRGDSEFEAMIQQAIESKAREREKIIALESKKER